MPSPKLPSKQVEQHSRLQTPLEKHATMKLWLSVSLPLYVLDQVTKALVLAKILTFAVSQASGFVGGPVFPALFLGGTAGVVVNQVFPGVPLGLSFTCLLAAVPGSVVSAPFSMVLLAAFLTQVGALQTAPILIAVVTAFLAMEGVKYLVARRRQPVADVEKQETPPKQEMPA